ncbi:VaFE repeat-containing surface-anchored protein [Candidatus Saccharibacteria bacterium]|nr:VaFE repeat-containing surface-anchored protein [Candidatus Saccharibacteria bacterium]
MRLNKKPMGRFKSLSMSSKRKLRVVGIFLAVIIACFSTWAIVRAITSVGDSIRVNQSSGKIYYGSNPKWNTYWYRVTNTTRNTNADAMCLQASLSPPSGTMSARALTADVKHVMLVTVPSYSTIAGKTYYNDFATWFSSNFVIGNNTGWNAATRAIDNLYSSNSSSTDRIFAIGHMIASGVYANDWYALDANEIATLRTIKNLIDQYFTSLSYDPANDYAAYVINETSYSTQAIGWLEYAGPASYTFRLHKVDSTDNTVSLSGASFMVCELDSNGQDTSCQGPFTTGNDGYTQVITVSTNRVRWYETNYPSGYTCNGSNFRSTQGSHGYCYQSVASNSGDIQVVNDPVVTARVKIKKVDSETLTANARGSVSVAGSRYGVYTSGGIRITTITIGADGTGVSADEIPEGNNYYIQEISAATGYDTDSTLRLTFSVSASDDGTTIDLTSNSTACTTNSTSACYFTNDIIMGKIRFTKVGFELSGSGENSTRNLSGVYFTAVNTADSSITYTIGPTAADGSVTSPNMIYGTYTVTENAGSGNAAYAMATFTATVTSATTRRNAPYDTNIENTIPDTPSLSTKARNSSSSFESPSNVLDISNAAGVTDRITCSGLSPNHKYRFVGYLWDIAAHAKVVTGGSSSTDVVGDITFTTTSSGNCPAGLDMVFPTFDSFAYRGKTLGIIQYLYKNNGTTTDDWVLITIHNRDLSDTDEQVTVKDISITTTASDKADGDKNVAVGHVIVLDNYSIVGLRNGDAYTLTGYLKDSSNHTIATATDTINMTLPTGTAYTNTMELSFDSSNYAGQTLSVYVELKDSTGTVIADHNANLADANEQVTIMTPAISTVAVSNIDGAKKLPVGNVSVKDTISYTGLVPGDTYYLSGRIIRKSNNAVVAQKVNHSFSPSSQSGSEVVIFDVFDTTLYYAYTSGANQEEFLVQEWLTRDQTTLDALVGGGSNLAKHIEDNADQTVGIVTPTISTTATNKADGTHSLGIGDSITISDRVQYSGLVENDWYKLVGTLVDVSSCTNPADVSTCSPLEVDGHVVQGSKSFKAAAGGAGTETIEITFNTIHLQGKTLVMFERLYRDESHHNDGRLIAVHEDTSDTDQTLTVKVVSITTTASDKADGDNVLAYEPGQIVKDVIHYENLLPNTQYTLRGCLYNKTAGELLLDSGGNEICKTVSFTTGDDVTSGDYTMEFTLDASDLPGVEIVVFETLFYGDTTDEDDLIASHENPDAPSQTVKVAIRVGTTAADLYDGDQTVGVGKVTVIDKLKYEGTTMGETYKVKGWLVDKDTGEPIYGIEVFCEEPEPQPEPDEEPIEDEAETNDDSDEESEDGDSDDDQEEEPDTTTCTHNQVAVVAEETFVIGEDGTEETTGYVELRFEFDDRELIGKNIVVYEELYFVDDNGDETLVAEHKDLNDDKQTIAVAVPEIHTVATDSSDGDKELANNTTVIIVDRVDYTGLVAGTTYTLYGRLVDKNTGEPIDADGAIVSFVFTPSRDAGSEEIVFTINTTGLDGKELVVFETLYIGEDEEIIEDDIVAEHADLNDENQTVWVKIINPNTGFFTKSIDEAKQSGIYIVTVITGVLALGSWLIWRSNKRRKITL